PTIIGQASGSTHLAVHLGGTLATPTAEGSADLDDVALSLPELPFAVTRLTGRIVTRGEILSTTSLSADLSPSGHLTIASPAQPATLSFASQADSPIGWAVVPLEGRSLSTSKPLSGFSLRDADFKVRLAHSPDGPWKVTGDVEVESAEYKSPKASPKN